MCPLQVLIQWQSHDGRFSSHQVGLKELIPEETFIRIQKIHPFLLRQCHEVPPLSLKQLEPETFIQVQKIHPSLLRQCHVVPPLSLKQYLKPSYRYRYRIHTFLLRQCHVVPTIKSKTARTWNLHTVSQVHRIHIFFRQCHVVSTIKSVTTKTWNIHTFSEDPHHSALIVPCGSHH